MQYGRFRDHFGGVGIKRLSAVDADPRRSNQHEVGTTAKMRRDFLGDDHRRRFQALFLYLDDDDGLAAQGTATHYDARRHKPARSPEWRLYYSANTVTHAMQAGDTLFLAMGADRVLYFIVAQSGSTSEQQLLWLFGEAPERSFASRRFAEEEVVPGFAARFILDSIGIELRGASDEDDVDSIVEPLAAFPSTAEFSRRARESLPHVNALDDPDGALLAWMHREEAMFRRLERRLVAERLRDGFVDGTDVDVDAFISFSLSVQNRRKSRMGQALEHHLEALFVAFEVAYVRNAITENNHRPDFLFPDLATYRKAPVTGSQCLAMLGAKSSCKERWRQVLAEADKIPVKHLLTLEPSISEAQTDQMAAASLQLVVPNAIHETYTGGQRAWLMSLADFVREVGTRSRSTGGHASAGQVAEGVHMAP